MKPKMLKALNDQKEISGKTLTNVQDDLGYARSTVQRWLKGENDPTMEQYETLYEYFGGSMHELYAYVGEQEMRATENIGYQGAEVMVEHYEQRLKAKDEKYELLQTHHDQRIKEINENHKRSVDYLKDEIKRLRGELDVANEAATALAATASNLTQATSNLTGKKHVVFWVLAGLNVLLAILLWFALRTGPLF